MKGLTREHYWAYFLLASRVLLAWTLLRYGWAKLAGNQFGVDEKTMNLPLKEVGLFRLSWYLADQQPFKAFIGLSQLFTALLLSINRTTLLGAFISIPIWLNILMWDVTFMEGFTSAFFFRLSFYLLLTSLLIHQNRTQVLPALQSITRGERNTVKFPLWAYLILPIAAIGVEVIGAVPNAIWSYVRLLIK